MPVVAIFPFWEYPDELGSIFLIFDTLTIILKYPSNSFYKSYNTWHVLQYLKPLEISQNIITIIDKNIASILNAVSCRSLLRDDNEC